MRHIATNDFSLQTYTKAMVFAFICMLSPAALAGSSSDLSDVELEKIKNEARDFVEAVDKYSVKQKRKTMREIDQAVLKMDDNIERLEKRLENQWDEMSKESREKTADALKEIREQRIVMAERYGSLKSSTDTAWDEMKTGFTEAYQELHEAWVESEEAFSR